MPRRPSTPAGIRSCLALCLSAALILGAASLGCAQKPSANDTARLLAGLPVSGAAADNTGSETWKTYREAIRPLWKGFEEGRGATMSSWAESVSPGSDAESVFYPFGGPDFMTVQRLHPRALRYTLVAMEVAGPLLDLSSPEAATELLPPFHSATRQFTTLGYFATAALRRYTTKLGEIKAISGILAMSAARAGYEVRSIEPLAFDDERGELTISEEKEPSWDSVRLTLRREDGQTVLLDYVVLNLQDRGLVGHPKRKAWLRAQSKNHTFLKAATHSLQGESFRFLARSILRNAPSVLQDESGLAYSDLDQTFDVRLFGQFDGISPHLFRKKGKQKVAPPVQAAEKALITAYDERDDVEPLPFEIGYSKPAGSSLQYAVRRAAAN